MSRIERTAEDVATFIKPPGLASLFRTRLGVVATFTERGELVEVRKRITTSTNRLAMIDRNSRLDFAVLHARLTQRTVL
jgi:hypothetical protein